jgi:hypothetical protein
MRCGRDLLFALVAIALLGATAAQAADTLAVDVVNASEPTLCAEKDNVYLKLQSGEVRRFTVTAAHPAYIGTIVQDRWAPDFTIATCRRSFVQVREAPADDLRDRGMVAGRADLPSFWRGQPGAVRVGNRVETGFHLLQLWTWRDGARRRGAGALSGRRLLARAAVAAAEPALERLRLVVPGRPDRGGRPAVRRYPRRGVRACDADIHA